MSNFTSSPLRFAAWLTLSQRGWRMCRSAWWWQTWMTMPRSLSTHPTMGWSPSRPNEARLSSGWVRGWCWGLKDVWSLFEGTWKTLVNYNMYKPPQKISVYMTHWAKGLWGLFHICSIIILCLSCLTLLAASFVNGLFFSFVWSLIWLLYYQKKKDTVLNLFPPPNSITVQKDQWHLAKQPRNMIKGLNHYKRCWISFTYYRRVLNALRQHLNPTLSSLRFMPQTSTRTPTRRCVTSCTAATGRCSAWTVPQGTSASSRHWRASRASMSCSLVLTTEVRGYWVVFALFNLLFIFTSFTAFYLFYLLCLSYIILSTSFYLPNFIYLILLTLFTLLFR